MKHIKATLILATAGAMTLSACSAPNTYNPNDPNQLFWWFFPSPNPAAEKEILIWLNGGVSFSPSDLTVHVG